MHELLDKYKYIIFDFDGTVNNTMPGISATFKTVLDHFGVDYGNVDFRRHIGPPLEFSYEELVGKQHMDEAIAMHCKVFDETDAVTNSRLYDGIVDVLAALKAHGYVLGIASSKYEPHALRSVQVLGIAQYFDYVYAQTERRGYKAEVLRQLVDDHGWARKDCLMIGDTAHDMNGARDNGIDFMAVTYGFGNRDELLASHPVAVADTPADIAKILL